MRITSAGLRGSDVHDVAITGESPSYHPPGTRGARRSAPPLYTQRFSDELMAHPVHALELEDLLGQSARRLLGHVVTAASENAATDVGRDETHGVDEPGADAGLGGEGEYGHVEFAFSARPAGLYPWG